MQRFPSTAQKNIFKICSILLVISLLLSPFASVSAASTRKSGSGDQQSIAPSGPSLGEPLPTAMPTRSSPPTPYPTRPAPTRVSTSTAPRPATDVQLTGVGPEGTVQAGQNITYKFIYTNKGTQKAENAVLTTYLPANTSFINTGCSAGWRQTKSGLYSMNLGSLAPRQGGMVSFCVVVHDPLPENMTAIKSNANITITNRDINPANNSASIQTFVKRVPDLVVTKSDNIDGFVTPSETILYTIDFSNTGSKTAEDVVLHETLPANTVFDAASSAAGWQQVDLTDE
jgi:large repetitive protein